MSDTAVPQHEGVAVGRPKMDHKPHTNAVITFLLLLALGVGFALHGLLGGMNQTGAQPLAIGAFVLLGIALLIALGFEFVNGFHDTANAVATVIYTHTKPASQAGF
jgi:PiT family inorganic phosphate transporter